jgi:hypothetical protein
LANDKYSFYRDRFYKPISAINFFWRNFHCLIWTNYNPKALKMLLLYYQQLYLIWGIIKQ